MKSHELAAKLLSMLNSELVHAVNKALDDNLNKPDDEENDVMDKPVINLSNAKVGDELIDSAGHQVTVVLRGSRDEILVKYDTGHLRLFEISSGSACRFDDQSDPRKLVSKIDPNAWWKDLPPAEVFYDSVEAIRYSSDNGWEYTNNSDLEAQYFHQNNIIRICTCPETSRDKVIKISDLKKWQEGK